MSSYNMSLYANVNIKIKYVAVIEKGKIRKTWKN